MFCTNVYLTTQVEVVNLENDDTGYVDGFIFLEQSDLYS